MIRFVLFLAKVLRMLENADTTAQRNHYTSCCSRCTVLEQNRLLSNGTKMALTKQQVRTEVTKRKHNSTEKSQLDIPAQKCEKSQFRKNCRSYLRAPQSQSAPYTTVVCPPVPQSQLARLSQYSFWLAFVSVSRHRDLLCWHR